MRRKVPLLRGLAIALVLLARAASAQNGRVQGVVAIEIGTGAFVLIQAKAVIIATGGAGRVFRENTNGGIVTGDGMALAYRHGVPLRDMEFVQYHPTCMPGTGLLFTEACRGEGGFLLNDPWLHGTRLASPERFAGYQSDVLCERAAGIWKSAKNGGER